VVEEIQLRNQRGLQSLSAAEITVNKTCVRDDPLGTPRKQLLRQLALSQRLASSRWSGDLAGETSDEEGLVLENGRF
jgi:hypothetical protein